ncbi:hypothetical protein L917_13172 [Phytophthora nicotianae]|uniref:Tf2-1-like SH3-like domain-containing protein n=1 Tax=Phytophthora nicotianae TaxID=4792 RepID=W2KRI1_PHYNI|nr:hypothetical protein L917_13172 [Phytophthora nicotianae]
MERSIPDNAQTDDAGSTSVNVLTRHGSLTARPGMRTRAATRTAPSPFAEWTSRALINPRQRRRAVELQPSPDSAPVAEPPPANFDPNPEPQPRDIAAAHGFVDQRDSIIRYVRDAIATAVDRQKEYADQRGRKHLERFNVGDRVLLSTLGITPTSVTYLGANKLAPRFIGPFKIVKVLGDAYTLQLPTALRLHPTFYVGRLRRYHPATIPSDAVDPPRPHTGDLPTRRAAAAPDDASPDSPAPDPPRAGADAASPRRTPTRADPPFERDGPAPLVDTAGHARHIVDRILNHADPRAILIPHSGATWCAGWAPCRIAGSLVTSSSLIFRTVAAYETDLAPVTDRAEDAPVRRA